MACRSPVLFLVFNRPSLTAKVFAEIRAARPPVLYVAADGPRKTRPDEARLCAEARAVVTQVDWPCEVRTLFRDENLGCRDAVSSALDWVFEHEAEAIVLEDDCLPAPDFFSFCDAMLERYRGETRIRHITGTNLQHGIQRGTASYYFSRISHVWGWASWRRAWNDYDKKLRSFSRRAFWRKLNTAYRDPIIAEYFMKIFDRLRREKIDTWDFQLQFTNLFHDGLTIIPNVNLISNVGFGPDATHTLETDSENAGLSTHRLGPLVHPDRLELCEEADLATLTRDLDLATRRRRSRQPLDRVKRWFRRRSYEWFD